MKAMALAFVAKDIKELEENLSNQNNSTKTNTIFETEPSLRSAVLSRNKLQNARELHPKKNRLSSRDEHFSRRNGSGFPFFFLLSENDLGNRNCSL